MRLFVCWLIDLLSNFRMHIAVISILCGMMTYWYLNDLHLSIIFIVPFFYALYPVNSWFINNNSTQDDEELRYKIGSFNLEWNAAEHARSIEYVNNSQMDILVLQEVTEKIKHGVAPSNNIYAQQYGEGHSHVMVLSKHRLEFVEYLPWPGKYHQRALHVICYIDEKPLHIFAIHVQVTRSWYEIDTRNQQINTLIEKLELIDEPFILLGDFNAGTGSNVLREIERRTNNTNKERLLPYRATWPARLGLFGIQLDHIYSNAHIITGAIQVGPVLDSDHRPICTKFDFA